MHSVGFIGVGNMGSGMAANLAANGYEVKVFDLSPEAVDKAIEHGCQGADSIEQAVKNVDVVVTMLPSGKHVAEVYQQHVFDAVLSNTLLIDSSTIDVDTAKLVAAQAGERGLAMVDAPVSGGIKAAADGVLTFMVGGEKEGFARAEAVLAAMGKKIVHAGGAGAGQAAKICNNMLLGASMIATCETFALAEKLGLDQQTFFDIASNASGQNWSMTSYCPVPGVGPVSPADNDYQGGFAAALMLKDLTLAMAGAEGVDAHVPMGKKAADIYQQFCDAGNQGKDFSAVIQYLENL